MPAGIPATDVVSGSWSAQPTEGTSSTSPAGSRIRPVHLAIGAAALVVVMVGGYMLLFGHGNSGGIVAPKRTITGSIVLFQDTGYLSGDSYSSSNFDTLSGGCAGTGGYSDLAQGVSVVVSNETGKTLLTVPLGPGKLLANGVGCKFSFVASGLANAQNYSIEVSNRGNLTYTRSELDASNWKIDLSIGS